MDTITVTIPGTDTSKSRMQKKGWKCWAKNITYVETPATSGYSYRGSVLAEWETVEIVLGSVILHVDDSSCARIGVAMQNSAGDGCLSWIESTTSTWPGALAKCARTLLAMTPEERLKEGAKARLAALRTRSDVTPETLAYYEQVAAGAPPKNENKNDDESASAPNLLAAISDADLLAEVARRGLR